MLVRSLCLPVLLYAVEVLPLTKSEIATLNLVLDRAVYRIFGCSSAEDTSLSEQLLICRVLNYALLVGFTSLFRSML